MLHDLIQLYYQTSKINEYAFLLFVYYAAPEANITYFELEFPTM